MLMEKRLGWHVHLGGEIDSAPRESYSSSKVRCAIDESLR